MAPPDAAAPAPAPAAPAKKKVENAKNQIAQQKRVVDAQKKFIVQLKNLLDAQEERLESETTRLDELTELAAKRAGHARPPEGLLGATAQASGGHFSVRFRFDADTLMGRDRHGTAICGGQALHACSCRPVANSCSGW
ncbi:hypothetical protein quinque_000057 [Culex quinquefasciatus]